MAKTLLFYAVVNPSNIQLQRGGFCGQEGPRVHVRMLEPLTWQETHFLHIEQCDTGAKKGWLGAVTKYQGTPFLVEMGLLGPSWVT